MPLLLKRGWKIKLKPNGISAHWSGNDKAPNPIERTWHPSYLTIQDCIVHNLIGNANGYSLSAVHDVSLRNNRAINCPEPLLIKAGDPGGLKAVEVPADRIFQAISVDGFTAEKYKNYGITIAGKGAVGYEYSARTYGASVYLRDVTLLRGDEADPDAFDFVTGSMRGVFVNGIIIHLTRDHVRTANRQSIKLIDCENFSLRGTVTAIRYIGRIRECKDCDFWINARRIPGSSEEYAFKVEDSRRISLEGQLNGFSRWR